MVRHGADSRTTEHVLDCPKLEPSASSSISLKGCSLPYLKPVDTFVDGVYYNLRVTASPRADFHPCLQLEGFAGDMTR